MNLTTLLTIGLVGILAQFIDGTLGMGYGVTSSSFLISMGIYPVLVSASVHTAEILVSLVSGVSHLRLGNVRKDIFLPLTIFGLGGGVLGAFGLVNLPTRFIRLVVGLVLLIMGCVIIYKFIFRYREVRILSDRKYSKKRLSLLGFVGGFIDAVGGGGWGPVCTSTLVFTGSEPRKAVGTVNLAEFFVTLAMVISFIFFIGPEKFRWDIVVVLAIAGIAIAPLAASLCKKVPARILGIMIGALIVILNIRIIALSINKVLSIFTK